MNNEPYNLQIIQYNHYFSVMCNYTDYNTLIFAKANRKKRI